jgi:glucokinase
MANKKVVMAIDCGGTNLRVAAVDEDLNILAVKRGPTVRNNPLGLYDTMKKLLLEVAEEAKTDIEAIGMSICGTVVANKVGKCGNLGLEEGFDFEPLFRRDFPNAKLKFANDANCSALAESLYGATKGKKDSIFITISSGIGIGIVIDGKMIDLPTEGGRLFMNYKGKAYETEYLLSGNGIIRLAALEGVELPSSKAFFDGVRAKDPKILPIYEIWIDQLSQWLANLHLLFDAELYAVSGGVMKSSDVFFSDLQKRADDKISSWHLRPIRLVPAKFDQDVGIEGAACLALSVLKK